MVIVSNERLREGPVDDQEGGGGDFIEIKIISLRFSPKKYRSPKTPYNSSHTAKKNNFVPILSGKNNIVHW